MSTTKLRASRHVARRGILFRIRSIARLLFDANAPQLPRIVALLTLLYVVFPIDLVPDVVPILGWMDDLGVFSLALAYVTSSAARHEARAANRLDALGAGETAVS